MRITRRLRRSLNNKHKTPSFWKSYILDWVVDVTIAIIVVYIIITFAFQNMHVVGGSMTPTLKAGEAVVVNKLAYLIVEPKRNDIVAFKHTDVSNKDINLVKRIVGVPGDKVEIKENLIYINNEPYCYIQNTLGTSKGTIEGNMNYPIIVPTDSYFVLGDNIRHSIDSRYQQVGIIPKQELIGKIVIRVWPVWKLKTF